MPGAELSLLWAIPMAGILLSIAILPLVAHHFWEKRYGWVGLAWALAFVIPGGFAIGWDTTVEEVLQTVFLEYFPFVTLIGTLFVISGGIVLTGPFRGTPRSNAALLLAGTVCASAIGTTGASMLFIRPILRANRHRQARAHTVVFFIFLVSNVGGSLTPLGDPPLLLGFLRGVGFFWTTTHLLAPTAFLTGALLAIYLGIDSWLARRETGAAPESPSGPVAVRIEGAFNLVLLVAVAGVILLSGAFADDPMFRAPDGSKTSFACGPLHLPVLGLLRDSALLALAGLSLARTPGRIREKNEFLWAPLMEVAILFIAIFVTMIPVIMMLRAGSAGAFARMFEAVRDPRDYYWITGALSAFLDNAPSYLIFFETAHATPMTEFATRGAWGGVDPVDPVLVDMPSMILRAISAGAVFMGAMTYIGNGPNFMVRAIAVRAGVPMPSFFGYMLKWSIPILLPLLGLVGVLFLP